MSVDAVRELVAAQFPQWRGLPVTTVDSAGTDNDIYRLGDELSVRLPRGTDGAAPIGLERRWLPHLAPHLPAAVPEPVAVAAPAPGFPRPWGVYRWLDGVNLDGPDGPRGAAGRLHPWAGAPSTPSWPRLRAVAEPGSRYFRGVLDFVEADTGDIGRDALEAAARLARDRGGAAQLCVVRDGRVVLDRAYGCEPSSLFWIFSTSKPFAALLVHRLAERGALSLDDPVARHWPGFAAHGKSSITVRHVLQHRSGLPVARSALRDALAMTDWTASVRALERARPRFAPGAGPAYQYVSYGFLLGELLHRATGVPIRELLRTEILEPLAMRDTHLGLPPSQWPRHVPLRGRGPGPRAVQSFVNRRSTREAVIPAAGISTTARDLAVLYSVLAAGGTHAGVRLLAPATLEVATAPTSDGTVDGLIRLPIRWSHGFQLGGPGLDPSRPRPMGRTSSPRAFGHNGSNVCVAWADPTRRLAVAYLTNLVEPGSRGAVAQNAVSEALLAACPPL